MVYPPSESGPYVLGLFDPQDFSEHCPNEHHGAFSVLDSFPGAAQFQAKERDEESTSLAFGRAVEPWHEVADPAPPGLP